MKNDFYITWAHQNYELSEISHTQGCHYILSSGKRVFDFSSTSYHMGFGARYEPITNALKSQLDSIINTSPKMNFKLKEEVTRQLLDYIPLPDGKIFYTLSGAESIENAIKMARQITQKKTVIARENCYHGATLGALSLTGDWRNKTHQTIDEWTLRIPMPCDDPQGLKAEKIINEYGTHKIAAICIESIIGGTGVYQDSQEWWDRIQKICDDNEIFLIIDEVVCGFNRTGTSFGFEHFNIKPDFVCMAKMITGGHVPFGAIWTSNKVHEFFDNNILSCGLTNYAHPLGLAATQAVIQTLSNREFKKSIKELEEHFKIELEKISKHEKVNEVRQIGLLAAIDLIPIVSVSKCLEYGLWTCVNQNNDIILAPPLIATKDELTKAFEQLHNLINSLEI